MGRRLDLLNSLYFVMEVLAELNDDVENLIMVIELLLRLLNECCTAKFEIQFFECQHCVYKWLFDYISKF